MDWSLPARKPGLLDLEESRIAERHRLGPGEILLANPYSGSLLRWRELLKSVTAEIPRKLLTRSSVSAFGRFVRTHFDRASETRCRGRQAGPTISTKSLFRPLLSGKEADWSMGDDAPPAFLSILHRPLWDYCKQRFAQVTNPPIDPLRESHVMSLEVPLGQGHFLASPILSAGRTGVAFCRAVSGADHRLYVLFHPGSPGCAPLSVSVQDYPSE